MNNKASRQYFKNVGLLLREVIGWLLLAGGLNIFWISFSYLDKKQVIEAFIAALMGFMLFRGGLQLVKVAVAARAFVRRDAGVHAPAANTPLPR